LRQKLELLSLSGILLFVGTGLYNQLPSVAYIPVLCACALLLFDKRFLRNPLQYIEPNILNGFVLFNTFLLIQIAFGQLELHEYFFQFFALSLMVLTYALAKLILYRKQGVEFGLFKYLGIVVLLGLLLLLAGQIAQIMGYLKQVNYEGAESEVLVTLARPGGFLNPNATAAIAIVFLLTLDRLSNVIGKRLFMIALPLAITVVLLTQSRGSLIALLGYLLIILSKRSLRHTVSTLLMVSVFVYFMLIAYPDMVISLIDNVMQRFEGDASSYERQYVLHYSFDIFANSPLFGNGSTYLVSKLGVSSHNQLVEILVSYGLVGLLVLTPAFLLLYFPISALMFAFCVLPMFLFSHNFFDSVSYQVALGLLLVIDRMISSAAFPAPMTNASHRKLKSNLSPAFRRVDLGGEGFASPSLRTLKPRPSGRGGAKE